MSFLSAIFSFDTHACTVRRSEQIMQLRPLTEIHFHCCAKPNGELGKTHVKFLWRCFTVPPEDVVIEGYSNGSLVEVPHEQETVNLTCMSNNGKPAATLRWFR